MIWVLSATCLLLSVIAIFQYRWRKQELEKYGHELSSQFSEKKTELTAQITERDLLLNTIPEGFFLFDNEGEILYANQPAHSLLGHRAVIGSSVHQALLHPDLITLSRSCLEHKKTQQEHFLYHSNASPLQSAHQSHYSTLAFHCSSGPVENTDKNYFIIKDLSSQHHTDQIKKDFVANASHELRTPLSIIQGYLETIEDDNLVQTDAAMCQKFLEIIGKHTKRITIIIEEMLLLSRIEASEESPHMNKASFSLQNCVQEVLERLDSMITDETDIQIKLHHRELKIQGDALYWDQIFFNLIENALKQNKNGPLQVTISSKITPEGLFQIEVTDTGVGIPSKDLTYLFNRFYRVEKHHSQEETKGTGLGLAIVKHAVEVHGGTITASSSLGEYTTFTISLPREIID